MTDLSPAAMSNNITPPPALVKQWFSDSQFGEFYSELSSSELYLAACAAQWGADQELDACCEWLENQPQWMEDLRAARRPKPPSLKEQALALLEYKEYGSAKTGIEYRLTKDDAETLRRALEQLND